MNTDTAERDTSLVNEAMDLVGTEQLWSGQLLYASARLGILERLADDPKSASEIADDLNLHPDRCYRMLRALSHFGVFAEDHDHRFALTPVGELFLPDHPNSVRNDLLIDHSPEWIRSKLHLPDMAREGGPNGFVREFGTEFFDYLEANPEFAEVFNEHMTVRSRRETELVLEALDEYDFSEIGSVCDIGGGHGHLLCHLLETQSHLEGIVLELPSVLAEDDNLWAAKLDVESRCTYEPGDMFESVPRTHAYLMKSVLHDWDDEDCIKILSNVAEASPPDGRLFVVELLVPGPETSHVSKRLDMTMMVFLDGRERTKEEFETLLGRAGWELEETWTPAEGPVRVLEAVRS